MNDERFFVEDKLIITQFFLNTCEQRRQLTKSAVQAAFKCVLRTTEHPFDDDEADFIPLTTLVSLNSTLNRCFRMSVIST